LTPPLEVGPWLWNGSLDGYLHCETEGSQEARGSGGPGSPSGVAAGRRRRRGPGGARRSSATRKGGRRLPGPGASPVPPPPGGLDARKRWESTNPPAVPPQAPRGTPYAVTAPPHRWPRKRSPTCNGGDQDPWTGGNTLIGPRWFLAMCGLQLQVGNTIFKHNQPKATRSVITPEAYIQE